MHLEASLWSLSRLLLKMITFSLALFPALIVAGSRLEATEGQNVTTSFDIDGVEKADKVRITFKGVNEEQPSVVAQQPWTSDEPPPAGFSLRVEKGRVILTIQHVNISSSGLYEALAIVGKKKLVYVTLLVHKTHFSSTTAPPHSSTPKPLNSPQLHGLYSLILPAVFILGGVYFCKRRKILCFKKKKNWKGPTVIKVVVNGCGKNTEDLPQIPAS